MSAVLPETDAELIARCRAEYEAIAQQGGQEAQDACYRYAWALVHGPKKANVTLGLDLCEAMLTNGGDEDKRELLYLLAVGKYRQKKFIECRRTLKGLKEVRGAAAAAGEICISGEARSWRLAAPARRASSVLDFSPLIFRPEAPPTPSLAMRRSTPTSGRPMYCWSRARRRLSRTG